MLDRLRRGQPEARAELFRRYAPTVRRILFLQGYCEELDDAVQDVFIKVYRSQLPLEETFLAWFYKLILNVGRDAGRRRKTRLSLDERLEAAAPTLPAAAEAPRAADPALRGGARRPGAGAARGRGAALLRRPAAGADRGVAGRAPGYGQVQTAHGHEHGCADRWQQRGIRGSSE